MELRFLNKQCAFARIIVAEGHPQELAAAETRRIQEGDSQMVEFAPKGAHARSLEAFGNLKQTRDLGVGENIGPYGLVQRGEKCSIGNETGGLTSSAIQAQVTDNPHSLAPDP